MSKQALIRQNTHSGEVRDRLDGYDVIDCVECGFTHIDPLPDPSELERVYRDEYYTEEKPAYLKRSREDARWWDLVHDERFEVFEAALGRERRRIIDIGSGPGFFLKRGMERGWKCLGIEPSVHAAAHAASLGVDVVNSFLDEKVVDTLVDRDVTFDAAHLSEVLEHVPDPARILGLASSLLRPGGIVCCVVPNDYNPIQTVLRDELLFKPYWLAPPHHINYFDFSTLEGLMDRCGFDVVHRTAMFPMDLFLLMGDNYVGDDTVGRDCHNRRKRLEFFLSGPDLRQFKKELYSLMASHGIGRETVVFGVKRGGGDE